MRESKPLSAGPGQNYRRFAWAVLGLAVLVAIGASDFSAPAPVGEPRIAAAAPKVMTKPSAKLVRPVASWAMTDESEANAPELGDSSDQSSTMPSGGAPSKPASSAEPATGEAVAPARYRPTPGDVARLVAASRERSGGVDQGDEPVG